MKYTDLKVIPMPKEVSGELEGGGFDKVLLAPAVYSECDSIYSDILCFSELATKIHGVKIVEENGGIQLIYDSKLDEGEYRINIGDEAAKVFFSTPEGARYALSTLLQLMRPESDGIALPRVSITDKPDCEFRALMVDLARKWHEPDTLLFYVDLAYLYKIKYLHLHFMDTQSYTLPSEKFPKMPTESCHYTAEYIKKLNSYALSRGIELIPEIELPGHSKAMVTSYPELFANTPDGERVEDTYSLFNNTEQSNIICVGKEGIMDTLRTLLCEVAEMFPNSKYIHVGGDEATISDWASCRDCKRYMNEHGIDGVKGLYTHFVAMITDLVLSIGRTPIVWEGFPAEGAEKISREVIVNAWESFYLTAPELIRLGFKVINASWQPLYVVPWRERFGKTPWRAEDVLAWNIYNWQNWNKKTAPYLNPINIQPTEQVIGAQLCAWECSFEEEVERVKENLAALSERTWNVRRYATDEQFREKLEVLLPLVDKLIKKT